MWDGMPYHITLGHPGWDTTAQQLEVRSYVSCFLSSLVSFLLIFLQDLAAEISGCRFRIRLRKWSQVRVVLLLFLFSGSELVYARVLFQQDLMKTAYVVEGGDLLPLLGRLQPL